VIVVTGSIQARPDTVDELIALSLEHVHRSRTEPGCLTHHVHRDVEDPLRLVFFEQWPTATRS
jgi:quinol monooxygenase YgiN